MHDDFYMNLVDWSKKNMIAVGLDDKVWLHHLSRHKTIRLCTLKDNNAVSSVTWSPSALNLAVGTFNSGINYYDIQTGRLVRTFEQNTERVSVCAFNSESTFASGKLVPN